MTAQNRELEPWYHFKADQWWVKELREAVSCTKPGTTHDQRRAFAVLEHLLASLEENGGPLPISEAVVHKAIKLHVSPKVQGYLMGALREVIPMYDPRSGISRDHPME